MLSLISTVFNNDVIQCQLHDQTQRGREKWRSRPQLQMVQNKMVQNKINYQKSIITTSFNVNSMIKRKEEGKNGGADHNYRWFRIRLTIRN